MAHLDPIWTWLFPLSTTLFCCACVCVSVNYHFRLYHKSNKPATVEYTTRYALWQLALLCLPLLSMHNNCYLQQFADVINIY